MTGRAEHIAQLLEKHLKGELSEAEALEWESWQQSSQRVKMASDEFSDPAIIAKHLQDIYHYDYSGMDARMEQAFPGLSVKRNKRFPAPRVVHRIHFLRRGFLRYAAAILMISGIGAYLWNHSYHPSSPTEAVVKEGKKDILPGGPKAMLTLADGSTIVLDSSGNGQIATEDGTSVLKKDGRVIYDPHGQNSGEEIYNTMTTPNGGQYQLSLADGSKVWLNAASSITFPTAFKGNIREVTITGEVYFEIAKNAATPFVVHTPKESITVLGTSFNVNVYADEPVSKISLVDGAVKVNQAVLKPGQAYSNGKVSATNTAQDIAWKNGDFNFNDLNGEQAMRQLSRWYNVTFKYQENIKDVNFGGELDRSLTLSQVLRGLEGIGGLHFTLQGQTVIVTR